MQRRQTIWMVSGNKGGVGKSLFCLALASSLQSRGELFAVFDGDGRDSRTADVHDVFHRKVPARLGDFRALRPESHLCDLDLRYETQLVSLLSASEHLIVNTPDGADVVLKKWFDHTLKHTEESGRVLKFIYLLSDRPDGLEYLPQLANSFSQLYPVRNLYFGDESSFTHFNEQYSRGFHVVMDLPRLRRDEVRMMFDLKTYPAEVAKLNRIPVLSRSRVLRWQALINDWVWGMADSELPNLAFDQWGD